MALKTMTCENVDWLAHTPCVAPANYYVAIPGVVRSFSCGRHLPATIDAALDLTRLMGGDDQATVYPAR
jgi:hypothetical protein